MKKFMLPMLIALSLAFAAPAVAAHHPPRHRHKHHAQPKPEWHGTITQALAVAEQKAFELWGVKPCAGTYKIELVSEELLQTFGVPKTGVLSTGVIIGASEWISPAGWKSYSSPPEGWTECAMYLNKGDWPETRPDPLDYHANWIESCLALLHEWGHLTGHPHTDESAEAQGLSPAGFSAIESGMTGEQRRLMYRSPGEDYHRCGDEP